MNKALKWVHEHLTPLLVSAVFLAGLVYAVTASWQNNQKLHAQADQLSQIRGDLSDIKKSLISVLLDKSPNKSEIIRGLVSDNQTLQGIERFNDGNFEAAFSSWTSSAQRGNKEAAFAISAAKDALRAQVSDPTLSLEQRQKAQAALSRAAQTEFNSGMDNIR